MSEELFEAAKKNARTAINLDKDGNSEESVPYYTRAAEILIELRKFEKDPRTRTVYYEKAKTYLERVEKIQSSVRQRSTGRDSETEEEDEVKGEEWIVSEKPNVKWSDVANLEDAKQALNEAVILPMARPELFQGPRKSWKGILLFGPPGCGKTFIAKAVASQVDATFFSVSAANLISKWLGEAEKNIKLLYELAREKAPSVIFFDEVDALASGRGEGEHESMRRVKNQLLQAVDGIGSGNELIVTLGATNIPWSIDAAMRRRFQRRIYIPLPEQEPRQLMFKLHTRGIELADNINFEQLGRYSEGYSAADISLVCQEALIAPIRELDPKALIADKTIVPRDPKHTDFIAALQKIKPTVAPEELDRFTEWARKFG